MADAKINELVNPPFYTIEIITHYKAIITPSLLKFINGNFSPHPKAKSYHIPLKSHRFPAKLQKARLPPNSGLHPHELLPQTANRHSHAQHKKPDNLPPRENGRGQLKPSDSAGPRHLPRYQREPDYFARTESGVPTA